MKDTRKQIDREGERKAEIKAAREAEHHELRAEEVADRKADEEHFDATLQSPPDADAEIDITPWGWMPVTWFAADAKGKIRNALAAVAGHKGSHHKPVQVFRAKAGGLSKIICSCGGEIDVP